MTRTQKIKDEIFTKCLTAGTINEGFIKTIITLELRVLACKNMLARGCSWGTMCNSKPYNQAADALDRLNGTGTGNVMYADLWKRYCESSGTCWDSNLGDWLS